jgi:hypothetical protein
MAIELKFFLMADGLPLIPSEYFKEFESGLSEIRSAKQNSSIKNTSQFDNGVKEYTIEQFDNYLEENTDWILLTLHQDLVSSKQSSGENNAPAESYLIEYETLQPSYEVKFIVNIDHYFNHPKAQVELAIERTKILLDKLYSHQQLSLGAFIILQRYPSLSDLLDNPHLFRLATIVSLQSDIRNIESLVASPRVTIVKRYLSQVLSKLSFSSKVAKSKFAASVFAILKKTSYQVNLPNTFYKDVCLLLADSTILTKKLLSVQHINCSLFINLAEIRSLRPEMNLPLNIRLVDLSALTKKQIFIIADVPYLIVPAKQPKPDPIFVCRSIKQWQKTYLSRETLLRENVIDTVLNGDLTRIEALDLLISRLYISPFSSESLNGPQKSINELAHIAFQSDPIGLSHLKDFTYISSLYELIHESLAMKNCLSKKDFYLGCTKGAIAVYHVNAFKEDVSLVFKLSGEKIEFFLLGGIDNKTVSARALQKIEGALFEIYGMQMPHFKDEGDLAE